MRLFYIGFIYCCAKNFDLNNTHRCLVCAPVVMYIGYKYFKSKKFDLAKFIFIRISNAILNITFFLFISLIVLFVVILSSSSYCMWWDLFLLGLLPALVDELDLSGHYNLHMEGNSSQNEGGNYNHSHAGVIIP